MRNPQITPPHQVHTALGALLVLAALCLLPTGAVFAADVVTDGDMEAAGIVNWPHTDVTAVNSSAKAGDQVGGGAQSLKGTSATGRKIGVEWYNTQSVGVVNSTDTVVLSLWYGFRYNVNIGTATGTLYVDVKPASGTWTNLWSQALSPMLDTFNSGTVTNLDVSGSFSTTEGYDLRLRFVGATGNNNGANIEIWWDDVVLDVTAGNQSPTVVINNPGDGTNIGGGASYTIDGTADDTDGTVTSVTLTIQRQDSSEYWNGTGWQAGSTTVAVTNDSGDYDTWSYLWNWTADMDAVAVAITAEATDNQAATGTDTNTATVDTRAPQIATGVRFQTLPASGDASFTLASDWTEANPGTPEFDYNLNAAGYLGFVAGSAGNNSSRNFAVALDGDDSFAAIKSQHADSYGNGPTLSEDTATVYVLPLVPPAPTVGNPTANTLDVTVNENGSENGSGMLYAIQCNTTGQYVQADGTLGASEAWRTLAAWGTPVTVTGLSPATTYQFSVAAGNPSDATPTTGENSASAYGATGSDTTTGGNAAPTVTINNPGDGTNVGGGASYTIDGTANDTDGTVTSVILTIQRQDSSEYWNGTGWQAGSTTVAATNDSGDYDTWSYLWNWTTDMDAVAVAITAEATDDQAATGTDTNTATVDTRAPQIATGVRFQTLPTSGDASFTLASDWTEANPGTPEFDYNLNAAGYLGLVAGSAGNNSSRNFAVALDGDDSFAAIKSQHADSYGNGPTLSEDTSTVYVLPFTPPAPTVGNPTANTLDVTVNENGSENGSGMLYAIQCNTTGQYVQADGTLGASEVWRTLAAWGTPVTVTGLSPATTYQFSVAAGNPSDATPTAGENSASAYGATGSDTTSGAGNPQVQPQTASSSVAGCVVTIEAPYLDDSDADSTTTILAKQSSTCDPGGYATVGCDGMGGASPRSCVHDTATASTDYCYEVTFTDDPEGVNTASAANPQYVGPVSTDAVCTLTNDSAQPGAASATVKRCSLITVKAPFSLDNNGNSTTTFERGPSDTGPWTPICSNVTGSSPRTCDDDTVAASSTYYYRVSFSDADGVYDPNPQVIGAYVTPACQAGDADDTTVDSNSAVASSCKQITVTSALIGDADGDGWTLVEYFDGSWKTGCATLTGTPARQCLIPGLSASNSYDVRITHNDPDGVTSTPPNPETLNVSTPACLADQSPPMVLFLAPAWDAVVGGTDRIKVQVYEPAIQSQGYQVDGVGGPYTPAAANPNYTCGADCTVYEFDLDTVALALTNDRHFLSFRVVDTANNETIVTRPFRVNNIAGEAAGGGKLLRRMNSAQLCIDCHDLPTHSSQMTSFKYGNWSVDCLTCHTPHLTTNIYLIREQILTPRSGIRDVDFTAKTTGTDYTTPAAPYTGICEVCHTRTGHHRNDDSAGADHSHGETSACTGCHGHDVGFSGAGGACNACHGAPPNEGSHAQHTINSVPTSLSDATFNSTAADYGFACVKCHKGVSHATDTNDPHQVEVAGESSVPDTTALSYARDPFGSGIGSEQGPNGEWWEWDDGTCSNVYCHGNFTGGIAANTYTWSINGVVACGDCHKATNADPPTTGSHSRHVASATYNFDCVTCHRGTASGGAITSRIVHVNGYLDWNLNNEGDSRIAVGSTYEGTNTGQTSTFGTFSSCTNLYCHSNGSTASLVYRTHTWGTSLACDSCHGGTAGDDPDHMATNAHDDHVHNAAYIADNIRCYRCHQDTVTNAASPAISATGFSTYHVNGAPNVKLDAGESYAAGACTVYCHSNGSEDLTGNYQNPAWTATDADDCRQCHGTEAGSLGGEPMYPNNTGSFDTRNSHAVAAHVSDVSAAAARADCNDCHSGTVDGSGNLISAGGHLNGARDVTVAGVITSYNEATETCQNSCHTNGNPVTGGAVTHSPVWGDDIDPDNDCTGCHGNDETSTEAIGDGATALKGSLVHQKHVNTYSYQCDDCHDDTINDRTSNTVLAAAQTTHTDGNPDVRFTTWPTDQTGGSWSSVNHTCSNLYCHSDGQGGGPQVVPDWDGGVATTCASCHKSSALDDGAANGLSADHGVHIKSTSGETGTYLYKCDECHNDTIIENPNDPWNLVSTDISTLSNHVNASPNVRFSALFSAATINQSGGGYAGGSCANTYCHSPGDKTTAFNLPNGAALVWGTGSATCASCHPSPPTSADKANSHPVHSSYTCNVCHASVVNSTPAIIDQSLHVNGAYEVAAGGGYSFSPSGSPTTCASNSCHGNLTWGSTGSTCRNCHMVSNAGTSDDNEYYNAGTAIIDGNEWLATGHGSASAFTNESGNAAPNFDNGGRDGCAYCHTTGVGHNDTTNPYRLANTGGADGKNGVCLICHKTGATGYNPGTGNVVATGTPINARHLGLKHGTGDKGGTFCWDCHDPHGDSGDTGISLAYMIQRNPVEVHAGDTGATTWGIPATPATDLATTPDFRRNRDGTDSWTWGDYVVNLSYDGICQVCHDNTSEYTKGSYSTHNQGSRCTEACHKHDQGTDDAFKGAGSCIGCHSTGGSGVGGANSRRAIEGDFNLQSHHVGASLDEDGNPLYTQPTMGGKLTNEDCVVCHAEGTMSGGEASIDSNYHQRNGPYGGCTQATPCIDLKDADNVASIYSYNRDAVAASAGAATNWNSGNATWASETSTNLDPFCLTCHDGDGASAVTAGDIGEPGATAANPFNDDAITNEYDQMTRGAGTGAVVDIASRVASAWRVGPGGGPAYSATDRDISGEARYNEDGGVPSIADPPEGVYSRHAIRGQSASVYNSYNPGANDGVPAVRWTTGWDDTKVMGCADCHTTDGANTTDGNAHGAISEYLLKDGNGTALEGVMSPSTATEGPYNCFLCHNATYYDVNSKSWDHAGNTSDYADTTGATGGGRIASNGNLYGMACTNCHGGAVDLDTEADSTTYPPEFGTIHGTTQRYRIANPTSGTIRQAYRFMNGNSMRYYDPTAGWTGTAVTCYTLGTSDGSFGDCTAHPGGRSFKNGKPVQRNLSY